MGRVGGRRFLAVAMCSAMIMPPFVLAKESTPFEYSSPESSIRTVPALQEDSTKNPNSTLYRNVVPPVNPVMDAWRHLSPLNLPDDKVNKIPPVLSESEATKILMFGSLKFLTQHLGDIIAARQRYEEERAKKTSAFVHSLSQETWPGVGDKDENRSASHRP